MRAIATGLPRDSLECEAAFYAGWRHEFRGELHIARALYERAQEFRAEEAWEWHMSAVRRR